MEFNLAEFFWMGGYAPWVWSAYALGSSVLFGLVLQAFRLRRRALRMSAAQNAFNPEPNQ